ncbi:DEAD/DEAH box helicase [Filobacillus milosensis]|uniref:DEAD/DEAH box helicase n=1 Tax=Filobacillus milosensis TaxID=94137 RepID=A0A4Y8IEA4_9BACI|nr:DEAD/DEAH box helicase [Filobacillus milosensis]TFB14240.1 DEAD/DEAH box helicase [Filobacillus milosensis]
MLNRQTIKNLFSNTIYQRGQRYYNQGKVINLSYEEELDQWHASVLGTKTYRVTVELIGDNIQYYCNCPAHDQYGQCKHSAAVLLAVLNERKKTNMFQPDQDDEYLRFREKLNRYFNREKDEPKDYSTELIDLFSGQTSVNPSEDPSWGKEQLQVEYTLKTEDKLFFGKLFSIEMKVGVERTYVVKSMKKFLESISDKREHVFTSKFSYHPDDHYFAEDDRKIVDYLIQIYENEDFYESQWQKSATQKGMIIPPAFTDQLLPLLAERGVSFENGSNQYSTFKWINEELPFDFSLTTSKNGYALDTATINQYEHFKNYGIVIDENNLYRLTKAQQDIVKQVFKLLNQESNISISTQQMDEFVSQVIPHLKKIGRVKSTKKVAESIVNPELKATLHLDQVEHRLTAKLRYWYDDIEIDPMKPNDIHKPDPSQILIRDSEKEAKVMKVIEHADFKFNGTELYLEYEDEIFNFLYEHLPQLDDVAEIYLTNAVKSWLVEAAEAPSVQVDFDSGENFLEVNFELGDINYDEITHIIKSVVEKKRFYRLPDGSFLPLEDESLTQMSHLLDELNINAEDIKDGSVQLPAYRGLQLEDAVTTGLKKKYSKAFQQLIDDIKAPSQAEVPLPQALRADLREYQKVGFQWLKSLSRYRFGGILADDMGLGKTLQSIAFLLSELEENKASSKPALIVSPASLVYNWQAEFEKFAPTMNVLVMSGSISERQKLLEDINEFDVVITSYPLVRQDVEDYRHLEFSTLIMDEAQAIKNHLTKQAKAIRAIKATQRFALSGTPIENSLDELWSIFDVILPGFFPSKKEFRNMDQHQVSKMSRPFILRRIKQDVLTELPDKIESVQHSELTMDQKQLYLGYLDKIKSETASAISNEGFQKNRMKILAGLTRLRQLCCHPSLFIEDYEGESGKMNQLLDMIDTARENGHRILIFSQFASMLKIIRETLTDFGREVFYLDGQTPSKNRVEMVNRFNQGEKEIFLISLKAGGTGLNLTGADTVILYDLWWNPAVEEQAAGRAHRIGQKKVVQVHRLITKGTIEEKIYALQQRKRELIENVIQPGKTMFSSLSEDEIRELLNV